MERTMVVVPEKKKRIEKIKAKYNNLQMDDKTAGTIRSLEILNNVLVGATVAAGVTTFIDVIVPDPVLVMDEAGLMAITGLLKYSSSLVENKIQELAAGDDANLKMDEAAKLAKEIEKSAKVVSASKKKATAK